MRFVFAPTYCMVAMIFFYNSLFERAMLTELQYQSTDTQYVGTFYVAHWQD